MKEHVNFTFGENNCENNFLIQKDKVLEKFYAPGCFNKHLRIGEWK